jgi:hypothetical protein
VVVMTVRRPTYLIVLSLALTVVMCLSASVYAAPPHFDPSWTYESTVFSPFPEFEPLFVSSITPTDYVELINIHRGQLYEFEYDYAEQTVTYRRRVKGDLMMVPVTMSRNEFVDRRISMSMASLSTDLGRKSLVKAQSDKAGSLFQFTIPIRSRTFESIFGEGGAGLKVSGYRRISFSGRSTWNDGQQTALNRQSKFPVLQMEQVYRFDIEGTIGSKISVKVSQDSRNDIPLANRLILRYKGGEDDVLQSVEAGNTTLNLPSTQFLAYSTRVQGLFGIKATARLADLEITAIASQEKGSTETIEINAGTSAMATNVIRDIDYKKRTIYDLGRLAVKQFDRSLSDDFPEPEKYDFFPGDSIIKAIIYLDDWTTDPERYTRTDGRYYIDPNDTLSDDPASEYSKDGKFEIVEGADYFMHPTRFYVQFLRPVVTMDDVVAVYLEVKRANGEIEIIGDISSAPLKLKLLKPKEYIRPNRHIWDYEWKNIYYLGSSSLDLSQFELSIFKGAPVNNNRAVNPDDLDHQEGIKYLEILGLDQGDDNSSGPPDGEIDRREHIDAGLGLLIFPTRHPFDTDSSFVNDDNGDPVYLKDTVPEFYNSQSSVVQSSSKYYMAVRTQERGNTDIKLNATNIIEGSEIIKVGDRRLNRGTDYDIDYDFGKLILLNEDIDINSNLSIMFETAPFFSLARKTLLGSRLEYAPNRDFRIGATLLYKSDRSTSRKPKVGEETSKITVWDVDFNYRFENPLFTTLANAFPFVTATAKSNVQLSAEVAQSYPNPNVDGQVFIDDFEGSKNSYSLGVLRPNWRHASQPEVIDTAVSERALVSWSNPIEQVPIREIWNRNVAAGEGNSTNVLDVWFKPVDHKYIPNPDGNVIDSVPLDSMEKTWAGFMRNISTGVTSQLEEVQQLELRIKGEVGIMHIDMGRITEDINGNGLLNTEDPYGYRTLDSLLDNGLDELPDSLEIGYDPDNGIFDPAGDNWSDDIWGINGTEGNRNDPDGGFYPDTEDPDFDGLELNNSYFSYRIDLSDTLNFFNGFYVDSTRNDDEWRTIRIPLRDPLAIDTMINEPSWENIQYVRVWFDGADKFMREGYQIRIASFELLSTTWADSFVVADSLRGGHVSFDVTVINDEIDSARYEPPPGVEGHYDQSRDVVENEQSLMLVFDSLNAAVDVYSPDSGIVLAADTGLAVRKFFRASNYMGYGKLEMFVYGGLDEAADLSDSVLYFFRMGYDKDAYYEFRTVLKPKWHTDNFVSIDFNEITGLKARLLEDRENGIDSSLVRYDPETGYLVKIKPAGQDPTLTRIQYFSMGVVNLDPDRVASGQVWADELRLTEVRDDVGTAARFSVNGNMSDLINYSFGYSFRDAYYRGVSSATKGGAANNLGSGQTKKDLNFSGSIKLDKFFPRSMEMQMPLSVNWSQNVQEPLLKSGTDIVVPEDLKESETSVNVTRGFRISEKFNKRTKNLLYAVLLNRLTTSFSYNISEGHTPTQPMYMRERYDAKGNYNLSMKRPPSITPLSWMSWFKVPFGLHKTRLYLYPTRLDFSGQLTGSYSESVNQNSANPISSKLDFRGGMNMSFKIFENLSGTYNFSTQRDLRDRSTIIFSFNPKEFKLGVEQNYSQSFRANYSPTLFRFLTHKFDYSATYGDTYRLSRDDVGYHAASSKTNGGVSVTFKHQSLFGTNKVAGGRGIRGDDEKGSSIFSVFGLALKGFRYITDAIKPVSGKFNTSRTLSYPGLADKATIPFRFGLTKDPGVDPVSTSSTTIRASHSETRSLSANSGVALFAGISVDVSYGQNMRETFDSNPTKTFSETWPDLKFNLRSIKGLWYLGKVLNKISPASAYSRSRDYRWHTDAPSPYERNEKESFAPLISFTVNPFRSMRSSVRYETNSSTNTKISETSGEKTSITKRSAQNFAFSWSFSFRNPSGIKLPLLGRIKFESNLSVTLDVNYRKSQAEDAKSNNDFEFRQTEDKASLTIRPGANYSFSSTVKGGLTARWQDSTDLIKNRKSHTREVGLWVELRF